MAACPQLPGGSRPHPGQRSGEGVCFQQAQVGAGWGGSRGGRRLGQLLGTRLSGLRSWQAPLPSHRLGPLSQAVSHGGKKCPLSGRRGSPRERRLCWGRGSQCRQCPQGNPAFPACLLGWNLRRSVKGSRLPEPSTSQHVLFLGHPHDPPSRLALAGDFCAGTVSPHSLGLRSSKLAPRRTSLGRSGPGRL